MCLIVRSPGPMLKKELFTNSYSHNSDGWGLMFVGDGRVRVYKTMSRVEDQWKAYQTLIGESGRPHAFHHRFATHGNKTVKMAHPFQILDKDKHGMDLWMMHNGVITGIDLHVDGNSDTWHFVKDYLRPVLKANPHLMRSKAFKGMIERSVGTGNKLVFLDSEGIFTIINRQAGSLSKDVQPFWFSNDYSLRGTYRYSSPVNTRLGYHGDYSSYCDPELAAVLAAAEEEAKENKVQLALPSPEPASVANGRAITRSLLTSGEDPQPARLPQELGPDRPELAPEDTGGYPVEEGSPQDKSPLLESSGSQVVEDSSSSVVETTSPSAEDEKKSPFDVAVIRRNNAIVQHLCSLDIRSLDDVETFHYFDSRIKMLSFDEINDVVNEVPELITMYLWMKGRRVL